MAPIPAAATSGSRSWPPLAECAEAIDRIVALRTRPAEVPAPGGARGRFVAAGDVPSRTAPLAPGPALESAAWQPLRCPRTAAGWPRSAGFHASWLTILLIVAINTRIRGDHVDRGPRPFWHPFVSAQCFGLAIAYAVNVASPWEKLAARPAAVRRGGDRHASSATRSSCLIKGYFLGAFGLRARRARLGFAQVPVDAPDRGFSQRPLREPVLPAQVSRDARRGGAAPGRGRAASALEARARVRAEADAGAGRAAFPVQHAGFGPVPHRDRSAAGVRAFSATCSPTCAPRCRSCAARARRSARRSTLAEAYLNILKMRMGSRLEFAIDVAERAAHAAVPARAADFGRRERGHARPRAAGRGRQRAHRGAPRRRSARR